MLVIQNNVGNRVSDTVIVAAITSSQSSRSYPVNVKLPAGLLAGRSEARMNQVHTLGRNRIGSWIARLSFAEMAKVDEALRLSLGLPRGD